MKKLLLYMILITCVVSCARCFGYRSKKVYSSYSTRVFKYQDTNYYFRKIK